MFVSLLELAILNIELRVLVLFLLECDSKCVDLCVHTLCIILKILDPLLILLKLLDVCVLSLLQTVYNHFILAFDVILELLLIAV